MADSYGTAEAVSLRNPSLPRDCLAQAKPIGRYNLGLWSVRQPPMELVRQQGKIDGFGDAGIASGLNHPFLIVDHLEV